MTPIALALAALVAVSWAFWLLAAAAVLRLFRAAAPGDSAAAEGRLPAVSILKPVCGADPGSFDNFDSFCAQAYPNFEVVFGVADADDPAIPILEAVRSRHRPDAVRLLVAPPHPAGANRKACLLDALARAARHAVLVASDADMRVGPDYLRRIISTLDRPGVVLATCPYRAEDARSLWARLEALHIGATFLPSAVLAGRLGVAFAMGATVAVRRADLQQIGGFAAARDYLADDQQLGARLSSLGRIALCPYLPQTALGHTSAREEWHRELRWSRCNWIGQPLGNLGYATTFSLPLALAFLAARGGVAGVTVLAGSLAVRWSVAAAVALRTRDRVSLRALPLLPLRDLLTPALWAAGLLTRRVVWRGRVFEVDRRGRLAPVAARTPSARGCDPREGRSLVEPHG